MKITSPLIYAALSLGLGAFASTSQAGSLTYDTWTTNEGESGNYILTIDDNTAGKFNFNLTVDPWNAEALALFVDLGDNDIEGSIGLVNNTDPALVGSNVVAVVDTDTTSDSCGSGCNLNGLNPPVDGDGEWELVFRLGEQGWDGVQTFSFMTNDFGLSLDDFGLVAIRAQQLCEDGDLLPGDIGSCNDSDKSYGSSRDIPPPDVNVPEPGSLALMALGLLGVGALRRKS